MIPALRMASITSVVGLILMGQVPGPAAQTPTAISPATAPAPPTQAGTKVAEIAASEESKVTFSTRVNLVTVPVVVRDRRWQASRPPDQGRFSVVRSWQSPVDFQIQR